jgi:hypothetical protein
MRRPEAWRFRCAGPGRCHSPQPRSRLRALGRRGADLERGLDGGRDELRGLRIDDDVPAEQHAADDLPGVRRRVARAGGGGEGPVASGSVTTGL